MTYQPGPGGSPWNPPPPPGAAGGPPQWHEGMQRQSAYPGPGGQAPQPWSGVQAPPEQWSMPPGPQSLPPFNLPPAPSPRKPWVKWVMIAAVVYDDPVIKQWQKIDYKIAASGWDSNQRQLSGQAADIIIELAHKLAGLGGDSGNPVMADFTALGAQYLTAYAQAVPSYTSNDDSLIGAGLSLMRAVNQACKAAG